MKTIVTLHMMLIRDHRLIRIYATPGIGFVHMRSKMVVEYPTDVDQCRPLERKITQRDAGVAYSGEVGVELNMSRLFNYSSEDTPSQIDTFSNVSWKPKTL